MKGKSKFLIPIFIALVSCAKVAQQPPTPSGIYVLDRSATAAEQLATDVTVQLVIYSDGNYDFHMSKGEVILREVSAGWKMIDNQLVFADLSGINHPKATYDADNGTISIENEGVILVLRKTDEAKF